MLIILASCDDGWFSRKRWKGRRASISVEDSKNRKVFIRNLNFETDNSKYDENLSFFLEKGYKWGYLSYNNTRVIDEDKKDERLCQIIGQYVTKHNRNKPFGDTILVSSDYYTLNKNIPVNCNSNRDTLNFYLVINRDIYKIDTISRIKVWDGHVSN